MTHTNRLAPITALALVVGLAASTGAALPPAHSAIAAQGASIILPLVHRFTVGATCNDIAILAHSHVLVIAQSASGRALALDSETGRQLAVIHLFSEARHVAIDAVLDQIYLPDEYSGRLIVARYKAGWTHLTITSVTLGQRPHGVDFDPRTHRVYVTNEQSGTVSIVDGHALHVQATVSVGRGPGGVGVVPAAGMVYVALVSENRVAILDAATGALRRSVRVGAGSTHLAIDQVTGRAAVVNTMAGTLSVVDGRRGTAVAPLAVGIKPYNVVEDSTRSLIVVASAAVPQLTVVDGRHGVVRGTLSLDMVPGAMAIDPARRLIIVGGANHPWVEVFSYQAL